MKHRISTCIVKVIKTYMVFLPPTLMKSNCEEHMISLLPWFFSDVAGCKDCPLLTGRWTATWPQQGFFQQIPFKDVTRVTSLNLVTICQWCRAANLVSAFYKLFQASSCFWSRKNETKTGTNKDKTFSKLWVLRFLWGKKKSSSVSVSIWMFSVFIWWICEWKHPIQMVLGWSRKQRLPLRDHPASVLNSSQTRVNRFMERLTCLCYSAQAPLPPLLLPDW